MSLSIFSSHSSQSDWGFSQGLGPEGWRSCHSWQKGSSLERDLIWLMRACALCERNMSRTCSAS